MEYIGLHPSGLRVSRLGFGCCPMGGHCWGKVFPEQLQRAVCVALDRGVNLFDTADIYGLGESERRLGRALKGRRTQAVIATKFGVRIDLKGRTYYDNNPCWIREALDGSLRRLGVDTVDLYQLHYRDEKTRLEDVFETLESARQAGKIRYYGLSNVSPIDLHGIQIPSHLLTFQLEFSLASRSKEREIATISRDHQLAFLSWGSLGQGILSGKYTELSTFSPDDRRSRPTYTNFRGQKLRTNMTIIECMKQQVCYPTRSLSQIAIRWILDHLDFSVSLVGIKNVEQIVENTGAFGWRLSRYELEALELISASE